MGLRELKKEQTRQLIAATAWRLFAERGFDQVTVAEVAHEAMVAPATVFNYFSSKEDLFFFRLEAFGARLVEAVANRRENEPALAAFRHHLLQPAGLLGGLSKGDPEALARLRTVHRMIADSPALQAREQRALSDYADALAHVLARDTGAPADDVQAHVVAHALMGVQRALIDYVRRIVLADDRTERLPADVGRLGGRAFDLLEQGLGDYAPKPAQPLPPGGNGPSRGRRR